MVLYTRDFPEFLNKVQPSYSSYHRPYPNAEIYPLPRNTKASHLSCRTVKHVISCSTDLWESGTNGIVQVNGWWRPLDTRSWPCWAPASQSGRQGHPLVILGVGYRAGLRAMINLLLGTLVTKGKTVEFAIYIRSI